MKMWTATMIKKGSKTENIIFQKANYSATGDS